MGFSLISGKVIFKRDVVLSNKYVVFCVFALFCGIVLIGQGVFQGVCSDDVLSENVINEQIEPNEPPYRHPEVVSIPNEGLRVSNSLDKEYSGHIFASGVLFRIMDGLNLSGKVMRSAVLSTGELAPDPDSRLYLRNINFTNSDMLGVQMREITFVNCSFYGARLYDVCTTGSIFIDCDFTYAFIDGSDIPLSREQLLSTASFRNKTITKFPIQGNLSGVDFSGFNLEGSILGGNLDGANFSDAIITRASPYSFSIEQLVSTACFKNGELRGVRFGYFDFSGMNLSKMDLSDSVFGLHLPMNVHIEMCNFHDADLTDSVISRCDFFRAKNLTLDQIKSTWNYKAGRMAGIVLPQELQEAIDAEKAEAIQAENGRS